MIEIINGIYIIEIKCQPKKKHFETIAELFCKLSLESFKALKLTMLGGLIEIEIIKINFQLKYKSFWKGQFFIALTCQYLLMTANWTVVEILTAWTKSWQYRCSDIYFLNFLNLSIISQISIPSTRNRSWLVSTFELTINIRIEETASTSTVRQEKDA